MGWEDETSADFDDRLLGLDDDDQIEIAALLIALAQLDPKLKRPHADTLNGSVFPHMKELRGKTANSVLRAAFAFDENQVAQVLCGGDKQGVSEKMFYKKLIAKADKLYQAHVDQLKTRKKSKKKGR